MSVFDDIRELKSRQNYSEAWVVGFSAFQNEKDNEYLKTALFWVVYAALKDITLEVRSRDPMLPRAQEQEVIDGWVNGILELSLDLPNENIDYRLWNLFKGIGYRCRPLCQYVLSSGRSIFHEQDHVPYMAEKGESPSVVNRMARTVARHFISFGKATGLSAPRIVALLNYARTEAKDSPSNKTWLDYDEARIYMVCGEVERARQAYLAVLKKKMTESWAWFGLAQTYPEDVDKAIKLIAKGLLSAHEAKFAIRGYILLAQLLPEKSGYEMASKALIKVHNIYETNDWRLKDNVVDMMSSAWFDGSVKLNDFEAQLMNLAEGAENLLANQPVNVKGVVESIHMSGKGVQIYINRNFQIPARKGLFPNGILPECATSVGLTYDADSESKTAISIEEIDGFGSDDICIYSGVIKVTDKGFAFADDKVFIPAALVNDIATGESVTGVAVKKYDKTKHRYGWKAVSLKLNDVTV